MRLAGNRKTYPSKGHNNLSREVTSLTTNDACSAITDAPLVVMGGSVP